MDHCDRYDFLSILQILRQQPRAPSFEGCSKDQRIVEPEPISVLEVESSVVEVSAGRDAQK